LLSVIIPNYNGERLVREFFPSVLAAVAACAEPKEILFVDDCSSDASVRVAMELGERYGFVKTVVREVNGGFSRTCNCGAARASGDILFFLNNDVRLEPDYFASFRRYFAADEVFALAPAGYRHPTGEQIDGAKTILWKNGYPRFAWNILDGEVRPPARVTTPLSFGVQGAYFFVDAAKFRRLGGFDELYSPYILEETDLCYRALKRGWTIRYGPDFKGHHRVGASIDSRGSRETRIVAARNRLIFVWKNIHSTRLLASHLVFLGLGLLILDPVKWSAFRKALRLLPDIVRRRRVEKEAALVTDGEILRSCSDYVRALRPRG
jgi:GT2 family glycosyltransferase